MTGAEIIQEATEIAGASSSNAQNLTARAYNILKNKINELQNLGHWRWLQEDTTHQTTNTGDEVAFSASEWPAAAITDYNRSLELFDDNKKPLIPFNSMNSFNSMRQYGDTGSPTHFIVNQQTVYLWPQPVTGSVPLLEVLYQKNQVAITKPTDDLLTVCEIPTAYHSYFISAVLGDLLFVLGDSQGAVYYKGVWNLNLNTMLEANGDVRDLDTARMGQRGIEARMAGAKNQQSPVG